MRSVWNGAISFGLVSIPVKTYSATDRSASVPFVRIHEKDGGRIQYRKVCELDGEEVPNEEIGRGYRATDDTIVPVTDEDLSHLPLPTTKTLTILAFLDAGEIDPLQMDRAYYLGPNGPTATKPYTLLREALEHHGKVAIGKVAMHGRETLAMLRAHDGAIVMHALLWPDQIRSTAGVAPDDVEIRDSELTLAETLMDSLGDLDPDELHDDYREAVESLVAAKLEGGEPAAPKTAGTSGGQVIDLMAALESSVRAAREGRGEETEASEGAGDEKDATVTPIQGRKSTKSGTGTKKSASSGGTSGRKSAAGSSGTSGRKRTAAKTSSSRTKSASGTGSSDSGAKKSTAKKTATKRTAKGTASKKTAGTATSGGSKPAAGGTSKRTSA
ncbi:Ku protein [Streptomyces benahoarensis]|uniref:Non-homologous end joining protein Ku n=1 Tax=Streptomyces benahoarensis TaxID=2595054 RepID=A0A553YI91_9ACTN|nr:Ku protein [Streptomyces benahoarensis]TSB15972.1 Ku protein [Streptomyces benahoarensis]TSB28915.1 Ku protein [Streptomyces benahoarensis]